MLASLPAPASLIPAQWPWPRAAHSRSTAALATSRPLELRRSTERWPAAEEQPSAAERYWERARSVATSRTALQSMWVTAAKLDCSRLREAIHNFPAAN